MSSTAAGATERESTTKPAVYVYGIVPAAAAEHWPAEREGPVRAIVVGDLGALVSDVPPDYTPGRREDLEAHQRTLAEAVQQATVIPMRFGIVMDSDDVVRERLLEYHGETIRELLQRIDGHVQMMIRAFYAEDALLREVLAENSYLRERSAELSQLPEADTQTARVQLGELISAAVEARRAEVESALVERLKPYAADIRVEPASSDRVALHAQLLVHRDRRPELDAVVNELSESLQGVLAFRYIGPLPPYSFTDLSLEDTDE